MSQRTKKYLPVLKRINKLADKNKKRVRQKVQQKIYRLPERVFYERVAWKRTAEFAPGCETEA